MEALNDYKLNTLKLCEMVLGCMKLPYSYNYEHSKEKSESFDFDMKPLIEEYYRYISMRISFEMLINKVIRHYEIELIKRTRSIKDNEERKVKQGDLLNSWFSDIQEQIDNLK